MEEIKKEELTVSDLEAILMILKVLNVTDPLRTLTDLKIGKKGDQRTYCFKACSKYDGEGDIYFEAHNIRAMFPTVYVKCNVVYEDEKRNQEVVYTIQSIAQDEDEKKTFLCVCQDGIPMKTYCVGNNGFSYTPTQGIPSLQAVPAGDLVFSRKSEKRLLKEHANNK